MGLWIVGIFFTDRWGWSQWLTWIPTSIVLCLVALTIIIDSIAKRVKTIIGLLIVFIAMLFWFVSKEHRFLSTGIQTGEIRLVGWTMSHSKKLVSKESAEEVVRLNGDITLLTHGWYVRGEPSIKEWLGTGSRRVISGPFTILTKLNVIEVRTLVASDGIYISMFVIDTTESIGKPLVLWGIDLPSDLNIPRIAIARRAKRLLESIDTLQPDIVMGDFNMTRNSYSIKTLFPELVDAGDDGGTGLLASFPMQIPLYHIDHTLMDDGLVCDSYTLVNPHIGRHRVQITELHTEKSK